MVNDDPVVGSFVVIAWTVTDGRPEDGVTLSGLAGVADNVSKNAAFSSCVAEKLFTYGLGRLVGESDKTYLTEISAKWASDAPNLRTLIRTLVLAEPFRYRRGEIAQ